MRTSDKSFPPNSRHYPRIERVILTQDWYACGWATGTRTAYDDESKKVYPQGPLDDPINNPDLASFTFVLYDPDGMITWSMAAKEDRGRPVYIPAGYTVKVYQPEDSLDGHWEFLSAGEPCAEGSSSSASPSSPGSSLSPSSPSSAESSQASSAASSIESSAESSEAPSSAASSEGPCACIPHAPPDSGESGELEAVLGATPAADYFWEKAPDGNQNLRHGIADRNRQEVYNGTSGTATFFQPEQGVNYKKVLCHLNAFVGTVTIYFPANFTVTPIVTAAIDSGAGLTVTLDSMAITTATALTGWYIIEGF